mmetsp:Transcript_10421/g.42388  ORF Transcript_10421/g.42388 Transcript_10421/m.42388 type:complete len:530 (+) Transcript_10421:1313-2902(+)
MTVAGSVRVAGAAATGGSAAGAGAAGWVVGWAVGWACLSCCSSALTRSSSRASRSMRCSSCSCALGFWGWVWPSALDALIASAATRARRDSGTGQVGRCMAASDEVRVVGWSGLVAIVQRAQEGDHVVDLGIAERRGIAGLAVVGHLGRVHVGAIGRRQVVELVDHAIDHRVPELGLGVARDVEAQRLAQRLETAVVEEGLARRDVAQRRHLEGAAEFGARRQLGAVDLAEAEVEIGRVGRGGNLGVARHTQVVEGEVGEQRRRAVAAARARVAGRAIALGRVVEQRQPAQLGIVEPRLPGKECVVLAAEGRELGAVLELVALQGMAHREEGGIGVVEDVAAEGLAEVGGVAGSGQLVDDRAGVAVGHFMGGHEGPDGLGQQRVRLAVVVEAAVRLAVLRKEEGRRGAQIAQRRHGAQASDIEGRAAELHREGIGLRMGGAGVVAARTAHLAGGRQRGVLEDLLAQGGGRGQRGLGLAAVGRGTATAAAGQHQGRSGQPGRQRPGPGHRPRFFDAHCSAYANASNSHLV